MTRTAANNQKAMNTVGVIKFDEVIFSNFIGGDAALEIGAVGLFFAIIGRFVALAFVRLAFVRCW